MVAAGAEPAVAVAPAAAPARSWFPQMTAQNIADYAKWSTLAFGLATVISGKATRFLGKIAKESMEDRRQLVESLTNIDTRLSAITRAQKVALVPIST
jgi:hypothetical protein